MPTGVVARFDIRRGYGFVIPDDGGEDVFVHQNNINMEGFRYLKPGEHVSYELEVGEKGMKAVQVNLLDARAPGESPFEGERDQRGAYDRGGDRGGYDRPDRGYDRAPPPPRAAAAPAPRRDDDRLAQQIERLLRKQERLISLLVAKGLLGPGEIDGVEAAIPATAEI